MIPLRRENSKEGGKLKVKKVSNSVARIDFQVKKIKTFKATAHFFGDLHLDNPKTRRDELRRSLDMAAGKDDFIIISGDLFDLMQLKGDPRASIDEIIPYLTAHRNRGGYVDAVIEYAAEFLAPYAENIAVISEGNHEGTVYDRAGVNCIERLAYALRSKCEKCQVVTMPYRGWIRIDFKYHKTQNNYTIHFDHGSGAGGRNKGITKAIDRIAFYPGADLYLSAHLHQPFSVPQVQEFLTHATSIKKRLVRMIQVPTFKDDIADGHGGWAVKKGHNPQPIGSYSVDFSFEKKGKLCHDLRENIRA